MLLFVRKVEDRIRNAFAGHAGLCLGATILGMMALLYAVFILRGGLLTDDYMSVIIRKSNPGFWNTFYAYLPLCVCRPLSAVSYSLETNLFGSWAGGYVLANLLIWGATAWVLSTVAVRFMGIKPALVFVLLAIAPVNATTNLASFTIPNVALLFAAASLWCLLKYLDGGRRGYFAGFAVLMLAGLLTYEVIAPFLVLSVMLPFVVRGKPLGRNSAPIVGWMAAVFGVMVAFQRLVSPILHKPTLPRLFATHYLYALSKLHLPGMGEMFVLLAHWTRTLLFELPLLLLSSVAWIRPWTALTAVAAAIAAGLLLRSVCGRTERAATAKRMGAAVFLSVLSGSALFVLSGIEPSPGGYRNRMFSTTWLLLALFAAFLVWARPRIAGLVFAIVVLAYCSVLVQRDQFIKAARLRDTVVADAMAKLPQRKNIVLIGAVPAVLNDNYNNETVFGWDFETALQFASPGRVAGVGALRGCEPESWEMNDLRQPDMRGEVRPLVTDYPSPQYEFWFYEYDARSGRSSARALRDAGQLKEALADYAQRCAPPAPWAGRRMKLRALAAVRRITGGQASGNQGSGGATAR